MDVLRQRYREARSVSASTASVSVPVSASAPASVSASVPAPASLPYPTPRAPTGAATSGSPMKEPQIGLLAPVRRRGRPDVILPPIHIHPVLLNIRLRLKLKPPHKLRQAPPRARPHGHPDRTRQPHRSPRRIHRPERRPQIRLRAPQIKNTVPPKAEAGQVRARPVGPVLRLHRRHDLPDRIRKPHPRVPAERKLRSDHDKIAPHSLRVPLPQRTMQRHRPLDRHRRPLIIAMKKTEERQLPGPLAIRDGQQVRERTRRHRFQRSHAAQIMQR